MLGALEKKSSGTILKLKFMIYNIKDIEIKITQ